MHLDLGLKLNQNEIMTIIKTKMTLEIKYNTNVKIIKSKTVPFGNQMRYFKIPLC